MSEQHSISNDLFRFYFLRTYPFASESARGQRDHTNKMLTDTQMTSFQRRLLARASVLGSFSFEKTLMSEKRCGIE